MSKNEDTIRELQTAISVVDLEISGILSRGGDSNASEIKIEHNRLTELLAHANRGEMITVPGFRPQVDTELFKEKDASGQAEKQRAKDAAGRGANAYNAAAAAAAAAAALASAAAAGARAAAPAGGAPWGKLAILGFALVGAGAAYAAAELRSISKDPPRYDFDEVTKFKRIDIKLPKPPVPPHTTHLPGEHTPHHTDQVGTFCQEFAVQLVLTSVALQDLLTSLEREAAVRELRSSYQVARYVASPLVENRQRYEVAQVEAVAHNADACANLIDELIHKTKEVNGEWQALRTVSSDSGSVSLEQMKIHFKKVWKEDAGSFREALIESGIDVAEIGAVVDDLIESHGLSHELPPVIFGNDFDDVMNDCAESFRRLSRAYAEKRSVAMQTWAM
jgi:hypothetical protein